LGATCCVRLDTVLRCVAMCCDMLGVVGSSLKMVNLTQQHPTCRNRVAKRMPYFALKCCDRLPRASVFLFSGHGELETGLS